MDFVSFPSIGGDRSCGVIPGIIAQPHSSVLKLRTLLRNTTDYFNRTFMGKPRRKTCPFNFAQKNSKYIKALLSKNFTGLVPNKC